MPTTVDQVARDALGAIGAVDMDAIVQAHRWVSHRYAELCGQARQRHLRRAGSVLLPAPDTTGTVTVGTADTMVVGTGTAWDPTFVGRWLRLRQTWYEITGVTDSTHLTIDGGFGEADATDSGLTIVSRYVRLPAEVRFTGSWTIDRLWITLDEVSMRALDEQIAPGRFYLTTLPTGGGFVADAGYHDGFRLFEIWPYSRTTELLHFLWWSAPPTLRDDDALPATVDPYVLREGVLIDVYRYAMAKALTAGRVDVGATWRNEMRAQETTWYGRYLPQATKADRGLDDAEWLFRTIGAPMDRVSWVRSARDHVYAMGNRP